MTNRWLRIVAFLGVLSLVLAACGGDSGGSEDTTDTSVAEDFAAYRVVAHSEELDRR